MLQKKFNRRARKEIGKVRKDTELQNQSFAFSLRSLCGLCGFLFLTFDTATSQFLYSLQNNKAYSSCASIVIFVFSAFDTGQFAFASSAHSWNFSAVIPGTFAFTTR